MPDFTVIEGGGGGTSRDHFDAQIARQTFERLTIELLRAIARGDDLGARVGEALGEFFRTARETHHPLSLLVHESVERLHNRAIDHDPFAEGRDQYENDRRFLLKTALRAAAEGMATDPAAEGRRSRRQMEMKQAIKDHVIEQERRSRANGWSYVQELVQQLGEWPSPTPSFEKPR